MTVEELLDMERLSWISSKFSSVLTTAQDVVFLLLMH